MAAIRQQLHQMAIDSEAEVLVIRGELIRDEVPEGSDRYVKDRARAALHELFAMMLYTVTWTRSPLDEQE